MSILNQYLNYRNGFFIEAGANDAVDQSNTFWLDRLGWKGLLVEPNLQECSKAKASRPNCIVENYALVSKTYDKPTIWGDFANSERDSSLTAMVQDYGDYIDEALIREKAKRQHMAIEVQAITLTELLQRHGITTIDFISLDVEGYEISVLNGIDFNIYKPKFMLIECLVPDSPTRERSVIDYMTARGYNFICGVDNKDAFFKYGRL